MSTSVWMLESSKISLSDGATLGNKSQGDGSHLLHRTITLNEKAWHETFVADDDKSFDDNDGNQKLDRDQVIGGVRYTAGSQVESEYHLTLLDPQTGKTYGVYGYNVHGSDGGYGSIEGLAFLGPKGGFPPVGRPLQVVATAEGPGSYNQKAVGYSELASPPCLVPGTLVDTPHGRIAAEKLRSGNLVMTCDNGLQPLVWTGMVSFAAARVAAEPWLRPIRIRKGALGWDLPERDLLVSPNHRMLISGWQAELHMGTPEVLVAAKHLVDGKNVVAEPANGPVSYVLLMLRNHQLIRAEGAVTESFQPLDDRPDLPPHLSELLQLFPDLRANRGADPRAVRRCASAREATLLIGFFQQQNPVTAIARRRSQNWDSPPNRSPFARSIRA
ncbi:MAG: hypothetical protein DI533_03725 [Cereibacter sphaeroides]|uniref:Hedgehog/Intein (Hint) domain-containing protein n=1 Tax=Cereibacter sphaeroides TaxID=1063 RepID=A0A2W5TUP4_CERSP|nr:MAG: hypothetical protein DI533_03725 [Cereibacter sphaeroides]